jgi:hypothetical protein
MSNMFASYETDTRRTSCHPHFVSEPKNGPKMITNIKGDVLGVQIDYASPLQLYFHLENVYEVEIEELLSGTALFEIITTTHKVLVSREFMILEILDQYTNDLGISLTSDEMKSLKKETYNMKVTLKTSTADYTVFAEKDGYLVIR